MYFPWIEDENGFRRLDAARMSLVGQMRFDAPRKPKGKFGEKRPGKPCGNSFISWDKECSPDKRKATSKENREKAAQKFRKFKGLGPKQSKPKPPPQPAKRSITEIGKRWQKGGKDRIYFESNTIGDLLDLSKSKRRKIAGNKFYYDVNDGKFYAPDSYQTDVKGWDKKIQAKYDMPTPTPKSKPFPNAMQTSTGEWVSPDEWDRIEGDR